ncbi:MAG: hypothetical protein V1495_10540 [Pseudomonadota bacterium]
MTSKTVSICKVNVESRPGGLAKVLAHLREARANQIGTWAWTEGNEAYSFMLGESPTETEAALKKTGYKYTVTQACLYEESDRLGAYYELLDRIGKAGVDLDACCAMAVGGKFRAILWAKEGQIEKLCRTLGCS